MKNLSRDDENGVNTSYKFIGFLVGYQRILLLFLKDEDEALHNSLCTS